MALQNLLKINNYSSLLTLATLTIGTIGLFSVAEAAKWQVQPRIQITESYVDNISLSNSNEQDDLITQITPGVSVRGDSHRMTLELDYQMQGIVYLDDNDNNDLFHQFQANGNFEVIDDRLDIDARFQYDQNIVSQQGVVAFDNFSVTNNRTDTFLYSITPNFKQRLGNFATAKASWGYSKLDNRLAGVPDSETERVWAQIKSGRDFHRFEWELYYLDRNHEFTDRPDVDLTEAAAKIKYGLTRQVYFLGKAGVEDHQFQRNVAAPDPDDEFYLAGFGWRPTPRTVIELQAGERFYGNTYEFLLKSRGRRSVWKARYYEDITTATEIEFEEDTFTITDPFGNPITVPVVATGRSVFSQPTITTEILIRKRGQLDFAIKTPKGEIEVFAYSEKREFQESLETEDARGFGAAYEWKLNPTYLASLSLSHETIDFKGSTREDDLTRLSGLISRNYSRKLVGFASYAHNRRNSNQANADYNQNVLTAGMIYWF